MGINAYVEWRHLCWSARVLIYNIFEHFFGWSHLISVIWVLFFYLKSFWVGAGESHSVVFIFPGNYVGIYWIYSVHYKWGEKSSTDDSFTNIITLKYNILVGY